MKVKKFESYNNRYLSIDDIKEIFIELLDEGYSFVDKTPKTSAKVERYFFELRYDYDNYSLGYIDNNYAHGITNLEFLRKKINQSLSILNKIKDRINSVGYTIGFEFEFNLSNSSYIVIYCNM